LGYPNENMPATEQTWRDQKLLHVVFAVGSVAMLITTIWMLTVDHRREWKEYQRKFNNVELWSARARLSAAENDPQFVAELEKREAALAAAQNEVPPVELFNRFKSLVARDAERREDRTPDFRRLDAAYAAVEAADEASRPRARQAFFDQLNRFVRDARFREDNATSARKFKAADYDVARSDFDLGVGNGLPQETLDRYLARVEQVESELAALTLAVQAAATHRRNLEDVVTEMNADELAAKKALEDQKMVVQRLQEAVRDRGGEWDSRLAKDLLSLPIIDAFGRPLKIEQIWLPKLTFYNNFSNVARFDRCITCHQGIDKTAPGSAVEPAYVPRERLTVGLQSPEEAPELEAGLTNEQRLLQIYGLELLDHGFLQREDAVVSNVISESLAAKSGLLVGDVIRLVGGAPVTDRDQALSLLTEFARWGQPIQLGIRRGLPGPYYSHPRLDLFVGSLSPHKMQDMGCTICHEGQGSGTSFKWVSHSPNDPQQQQEWKRKYGWFDNHHWIFPMMPDRHAESMCMKCHHEVESLYPSERFPEAPAPKLTAGYDLFRTQGCYGCHEVNGYDGPSRRIGPDLRTEPNYSAAAQALLATDELTDDERDLAAKVVYIPEDSAARRALLAQLRKGIESEGEDAAPRISPRNAKVVKLLEDVEAPGTLRKVGPSLRHLASKVDAEWLHSWVRKPSDFRPDTKMPQFFGLHDHLATETAAQTKTWEAVEIRGISSYLMTQSQPFEYLTQPADVTESPSAERGKTLFQVRGCLACHQHDDFPDATMNQGPNLSRVGAKFAPETNPKGPQWLYSWLKNPNQYHPRTLMPNLILDPVTDADGKVSDPAADIVEYLLGSGIGWKPSDVPAAELSPEESEALYQLALENLRGTHTVKQSERILARGIPEELAGETMGDDIELLGEPTVAKQLRYVGRRAIAKYGCAGCHDIPGFEDAKPIGTGLADWGRKGADKLAFEQIGAYLAHGHGHGHAHEVSDASDVGDGFGEVEPHAPAPVGPQVTNPGGDTNLLMQADQPTVAAQNAATGEAIRRVVHDQRFVDLPPNIGYYVQKIFGHQRDGFIWQKLREPRSYDYEKVDNKGYNERLRMPQFTLTEAQREAVITFVLGLVSEPPRSEYVYQPDNRQNSIIEGRKVLEKYNCGGCHTLKMDQWELAFPEGAIEDPAEQDDYAFVMAHASSEQISKSLETDHRGLRHGTIYGMPALSEETGKPVLFDEDGLPIDESDPEMAGTPGQYSFTLWKNTVLNGQIWPAGLQNMLVPETTVAKKYEADGGYLPRLIITDVYASEKEINPNAKFEETWAYLPPPLVGEGNKVQSNWLHSFLLDPFPIRPAVLMRMPKFNMSSREATVLANYFAAVDKAEHPYNFDFRTTQSHLEMADAAHPGRLRDALNIVVDGNYCVKCHLVGDYNPPGTDRAKGPQLTTVFSRLRPEYLRAWIANPKRILPYTAMPLNIPHNKPVSQDLFKGDSLEQLDAITDLLLNFDRFAESKFSIKPLIKTPPPAAANAEPQAGN
jgi:cytochrome c2